MKEQLSKIREIMKEIRDKDALDRLKVRSADTAPKRGSFLAFGKPSDAGNDVKNLPLGWYSAYYDGFTEAFCVSGATWLGPFIVPLAWCELPENPKLEVVIDE